MKKNVVSLIGILAVMSLTACGNKPETSEGAVQNVKTEQDISEAKQETSEEEQETSGAEQETEAVELYVNVLRNYRAAGKTDFTVSFIDLDDDSTREMVIFFGESQADGGYLFTIKDGKAIQVLSEMGDCFGQYGGFTYKEKENIFVTEHESVTEAQIFNQIFYYTMENGNAVCKDMTQSITQFDSDESRFYVNDTEVDSETFNSVAENYGLLEMSTVSYLDGVHVTGEQMDMVYKAYSSERTDSEMTSEELLDLFVNGSMGAIDATDMTSVFHITDFSINSEEWDSYSIGERVDLDNDGENELIMCGPYGGLYLDARHNKVYEFAMGADNIAVEMNFSEEPVDENNMEAGMKYMWNGMPISYDEYAALESKIFAAEVNTN